MTQISDAEAAEVLWASSEEGKAAVRAGWERAKQIGIAGHPVVTGGRPIDMADIGAIVYAAYLAAGWTSAGRLRETRETLDAYARHNADVIRENTMLRDENSDLREEIARREGGRR